MTIPDNLSEALTWVREHEAKSDEEVAKALLLVIGEAKALQW
jgi:hypothetical protein